MSDVNSDVTCKISGVFSTTVTSPLIQGRQVHVTQETEICRYPG